MIANWMITIVLVVLTAFNAYYLFYFKSCAKQTGAINEKDNYYKLDAKIELLKYLSIGLISIASLFGIYKLTDLSNQFKNFEDLNSKYTQLKNDYESLSKDQSEILANAKDIQQLYHNLLIEKNNIDLEFYKQDQKIKSATERIPDNNLRILARLLMRSHIDNYASLGRITDYYHTEEEIKNEVTKVAEYLKYFGFEPSEIREIIGDIEKDYPWINNKTNN